LVHLASSMTCTTSFPTPKVLNVSLCHRT
jgi:hypothetical protein